MDDGRLAVLDFGATLPAPGWSPNVQVLLRAARDRNADGLGDLARRTGLIQDEDVAGPALLELLDPLMQPLRSERFAFTPAWLRSIATRFSDPRSPASRAQRRLHVPVPYLLVQRVAAGTTGVLCQLNADVPVAAEASRWMPGLT